jgi:PAS domain S-box-containing protein
LKIGSKIMLTNVVIAGLVTLAVGLLSYYIVRGQAEILKKREIQVVTKYEAGMIDRIIEHKRNVFAKLCDSRAVLNYSHSYTEHPLVELFLRNKNEFPMLCYLNQDGYEDLKVLYGKVVDYPSGFEAAAMGSILNTKNTLVSFYMAKNHEFSGPALYFYYAKYDYFDQFNGALLGGFPVSLVAERLKFFEYGKSGFAVIADGDGRIIAGSEKAGMLRDNSDTKNTLHADDIKALILTPPLANSVKEIQLAGQRFFVASNALTTVNWSVLTFFPIKEMDAAFRTLRQTLIILGLVCMLVVSIVSAIVSRGLVVPLRRLVRVTDAAAQGDYGQRVDVESKDEVGILAGSFNTMIDEIGRTRDQLIASRDYINNILWVMNESLMVLDDELKIRLVNPAACDLLGIDEIQLLGTLYSDVIVLGDTMDQADTVEILDSVLTHGEMYYRSRDRGLIQVLVSASVLPPSTGEPGGYVVLAQDITALKETEGRLRESLDEKEVLLKEIHHRVKNNLQVVISLLSLQRNQEHETEVLTALDETQSRIRAMAIVHEILYQSNSFARINLREYLRNLVRNITFSNHAMSDRIRLEMHMEDCLVSVDQAIPCGLVVNEILTNAFKYAFPDERTGVITIGLHNMDGNEIYLRIKDNGVGIPDDVDWKTTSSLGLHLVNIIAELQLRADADLTSDNGTSFSMRFKVAPNHDV